jgi:hypothetical protein
MALKVLYWFPRILAILAIIFMMMFALDSLGGDVTLGKKILGFLAHNIPAFVLIIVLIVAWKYEIIGGAIFILLSVAMAIYYRSFSGNPGSIIVIAPFLIAGLMFILHKMLARKNQ